MKIALDAMGGDFAPKATIEGALLATELIGDDDKIVLVGQPEAIQPILEENEPNPKIEVVPAPQVVGMAEHPTKALKEKPKSSISIGYYLLAKKQVDAFCSAGNTGAMMVGAIYSVKPIEGIQRPPIISYSPKTNGQKSIIIDVGANTDCKPDMLHQFAKLGSIYFKNVFDVAEPRVALINLGEEEQKGNQLTQAVYQILKKDETLNFVGNIEGRDVFYDNADVLVCDGFIGNVMIKMAESIYAILKKKGIQDDFVDNFNYENIGGSPILGINGNAIIGHGVSNAPTIKNMLLLAKKMIDTNLQEKIKTALKPE